MNNQTPLQNLDALQSLMMARLPLTGNEWQAAMNSFAVIREALTPPKGDTIDRIDAALTAEAPKP